METMCAEQMWVCSSALLLFFFDMTVVFGEATLQDCFKTRNFTLGCSFFLSPSSLWASCEPKTLIPCENETCMPGTLVSFVFSDTYSQHCCKHISGRLFV